MQLNLIYYITPMGSWRANIATLSRFTNRFNGALLAVVAQGAGLTPLSEIAGELEMFDQIWPLQNDPELRETPGLAFLLDVLPQYASKRDGATFFAHTKGVTHANNPAVKIWTQLLYEKNLKNIALIESELARFPVVGCFKRYGTFAVLPPECEWHYSGTFFWFRNADLYSRPWQKALKATRYGAEAFPGMLFTKEEGGCVFADNCGRPYSIEYLNTLL